LNTRLVSKVAPSYSNILRLIAALIFSTANSVYAQLSGGLPPLRTPNSPKSPIPQVTQATQPQIIEVLGQTVSFANPNGYCTPGKTQRERDLITTSRKAVGSDARLVHLAVLCSDLEAFVDGRREFLDHWLQIQLLGPKGDFKRVEVGRQGFLDSVSKVKPELDAAKINREIQTALENPDMSASNMQVLQLGRDGNATYMSFRMRLKIGDSDRLVTGLGGVTLINSLPLSVIVYEATGQINSRGQLQPTLQQLLMSLLTQN